jgi:hypothetical protein
MLSDAKVRAAKPRPKSYKLSDANRLYLLVTPSGGRLWRYGYYYDGKQKTLAFGAYPQVSLSDARTKRDEAAGMLAEGHDPVVVRKLKLEATVEASRQTFERVAREWYANAKSQWAKIHAADIIRSLERDVFPTIGDLPIGQLTPPLILGVLREIETRGAIETAKRVRQRISAVFVYGIAQGIVQSDPSEKLGKVLKPLRKGRQPAITDLVPLQKMIVTAEEDYARPITRLALRLLALTAAGQPFGSLSGETCRTARSGTSLSRLAIRNSADGPDLPTSWSTSGARSGGRVLSSISAATELAPSGSLCGTTRRIVSIPSPGSISLSRSANMRFRCLASRVAREAPTVRLWTSPSTRSSAKATFGGTLAQAGASQCEDRREHDRIHQADRQQRPSGDGPDGVGRD